VAEVQEDILAEAEAAVTGCRAAVLERTAADSQVVVAERAAGLATAAYQRGETSKLEPALAQLSVARAERLRRAAERRLTAAGVTLEAALGEWAGSAGKGWPDPRLDGWSDHPVSTQPVSAP
jgi:outer membrane protein TolC